MVGDRLGPYEIVAAIGAGGMGEVYQARDTRLDRFVAIKIAREKFSARFKREARVIASLNHPNICMLYDVGPDYLVMEYVEGTQIGRVEAVRKLLDLAVQIADGLQAAHAVGIVHRDLKPANILVTRENRVKILDFGLAKAVPGTWAAAALANTTHTITLTNPGTVVGTVVYMSPEQARGQADLTLQSDQFSLGLILYESVTGKRPFVRRSTPEVLTAIIREEAEPLPPTVPLTLRWTIERCLAKDPAERYDSTRDLYRDLRRSRDQLSGVGGGTPLTTLASQLPKHSRSKVVTVVVGAAMLLIGVLLAALWPTTTAPAPEVMPFATESELQIMPRWSPQGDRIAFVADVDGILQVFTKKLGSSTRTQITREKKSCFNPFWSADATRIYYLTGVEPKMSLWSAAVAGGSSQWLFDGIHWADLSPDGKTLAVLSTDAPGQYRLALSSPPGAPPQLYGHPPISAMRFTTAGINLQFDPSGRYLGLLTTERSRVEFWKIPLDGRVPQEMLRGKGTNRQFFTWLDMSRIVTGSTVDTLAYRLTVTDLSSGKERPLTSGGSRDLYPSLGRNGQLAFASGEVGFDLLTVPVGGAEPHTLIATSRSEVAPSWAPNGTHFAYATDRSGAAEVWLHSQADGSEQLIVGAVEFPDAAGFSDLAISPDGGRIAYRLIKGGEQNIWVSPLSGETPVRLWSDPTKSPQRGPSWAPDGNWIAYYSALNGRPAVMKVRVGGNTPATLLTYMSRLSPVRWSPRGDWIAYRDGDKLRVVSPDGKQSRSVSEKAWETYGWSKNGAALFGIRFDENRRQILARIDIETAGETKIADLGAIPPAFYVAERLNTFSYRGFSLHPDGKSFLTSVLRVKTQIFIMENFDRGTRQLDWLWARR
jgi:Tol biopolymer transport system component/predicted Ser/Thr protein kinase